MTCYSPLNAWKGKSKTTPSKIKVVWTPSQSYKGERLTLPCGQCIGCRLERSRQWAVRCMHEASLHDENSFLTLTYDDQHLPVGNTLVLSDFQNFMKRLRRSIEPKKVRFYHCGEYGELLSRPHYHALLFGYDFADRKLFSERNGNKVYTSGELSSLWENGFSVIGEVTFESAAYVARYVMKKVTGARAKEHYQGRLPEYTTMSRRPGIGKGWYEKFKTDVYPLDRLVVRGSVTRPPRFYDDLFSGEDPVAYELIKKKREKDADRYVLDVLSDGRVIKESDNSMNRLAVRELVKSAQISSLKRTLEEL